MSGVISSSIANPTDVLKVDSLSLTHSLTEQMIDGISFFELPSAGTNPHRAIDIKITLA